MKTGYFTFGQGHTHSYNGVTFDKDVVLKITAEDPRAKMVELFGQKWGFEYTESNPPKMAFFPRGIFNINTNKFE
jgi:hypothetical protein